MRFRDWFLSEMEEEIGKATGSDATQVNRNAQKIATDYLKDPANSAKFDTSFTNAPNKGAASKSLTQTAALAVKSSPSPLQATPPPVVASTLSKMVTGKPTTRLTV